MLESFSSLLKEVPIRSEIELSNSCPHIAKLVDRLVIFEISRLLQDVLRMGVLLYDRCDNGERNGGTRARLFGRLVAGTSATSQDDVRGLRPIIQPAPVVY